MKYLGFTIASINLENDHVKTMIIGSALLWRAKDYVSRKIQKFNNWETFYWGLKPTQIPGQDCVCEL